MLGKLKETLARHPLAGFFALAGAAYVVFAGSVVTRPLETAFDWANRFHTVGAMVVGLVALVCCWAASGPRSRSPRRFDQLFIVVAVALLVMTGLCVQEWLAVGRLHGMGVSSPSLGWQIHRVLVSRIGWPDALVIGVVLAGVAAPVSVVRRTSRALVAWREPGGWRLVAVALLLPVACVAATRLGVHLLPAGDGDVVSVRLTVPYACATFAVTTRLTPLPGRSGWVPSFS